MTDSLSLSIPSLVGPILLILGPVAVVCAVAVAGYWFAKRSGLGPLQAEYKRTLEALNEGLDDKLRLVTEKLEQVTIARDLLATEVEELKHENIRLRGELQAVTDARVIALKGEVKRLRGPHP